MYFVTIIIILSDMQIIRYSFKSICYRFVIPARHAIACKLFCWALHAQAKAHWRGRWWAAHWRRYACDYVEWVWVYLCDREGQYPAFPARMWCAYMLRQEHIRRCAYEQAVCVCYVICALVRVYHYSHRFGNRPVLRWLCCVYFLMFVLRIPH